MATNSSSKRKYFPDEGVDVIIPAQRKSVDVVKLPIPKEIVLKVPTGEFQPFRLVINLKVVDVEDKDSEILQFDPPIEIRVSYTTVDVEKAGNNGKLILGCWNGEKWINFTPEKHNFRRVEKPSPAEGGWGIINISSWGDPTIAWGA